MMSKCAAWIALALPALLHVTSASAQGSEPFRVQAGATVMVTPEYEGSKSYKVLAFPIIAPAAALDGEGRVQFRGPDHLQFALVSNGGFQFGPLAGYRFGRDEDDGRLLHGLGDIDGGLVVGGFASYSLGMLRASASYHHQVTGDDTGGVIKLGIDARQPITSTVRLTGGVGLTWADDDYMQSFFGVTAAQALASGHQAFDPGAGIKDVNFNLGTEVQVAPQWMMKLNGRYARLVGDAADSPVIETKDQWGGGVTVTYSFPVHR